MPISKLSPLLLAAMLLALTAPGTAEAQRRGKGKRALRAEAKALFQEGQKHYTLGEFEEALKDFSAAYDKLPMAAFLFNIAQCHKEMKNFERAIFFFEGYLRDAPQAGNREMIEELIGESRGAMEKQQEAARLAKIEADRKAAEAAQREAARKEAEAARLAAADGRAAEMAELRKIAEEMKAAKDNPAFQPPGTAPGPKGPSITKRWWFWTAIGAVALAAAGTGTAVALRPTELPAGSLGTLDHRQ